MKTIEQIIKQKPIYLNDWSKDEKVGIISDFNDFYMTKKEYEAETSPYQDEKYWREKVERMNELLDDYKDINILFASYSYENYTGDAWVLFEQGGRLYEVNGSHCSCYGLEDQWSPEEVNLVELGNRLTKGTFGENDWSGNEFKEEICEFLGVELVKNAKW